MGPRTSLSYLLATILMAATACGPSDGPGGDTSVARPPTGGTSGAAGRTKDAAADLSTAGTSGETPDAADVDMGDGGSLVDMAEPDDGALVLDGGDVVIDASAPNDAPIDVPGVTTTGTPRCYLQAIIRDFSSTAPTRHPDFEIPGSWGNDVCEGLVDPTLGVTGLNVTPKPTTAVGDPCPLVSKSRPPFEHLTDWYQNTPGTNFVFDVQIPLYDTGHGTVAFQDLNFFPIDGKGWKDMLIARDKRPHNFGFTTHVLRHFTYHKGQTFTFTGDDDVWVYVEGKLAIDLGGLHPSHSKTINMDTITPPLVEGYTYRLDLFHAERKTDQSSFGIETSICDQFDNPVSSGPSGDGGVGDGGTAPAGDGGVGTDPQGRTPACYMQAIVRDFRATGPMRHPDFEDRSPGPFEVCPGIVGSALTITGLDATPMFVANPAGAAPCPGVKVRWPQITHFEDWYQNKPGTNLVFDVQIPLYDTGRGTVEFNSDAFFPIDGKGYNDQILGRDGKPHNYGFTTHVLRHFTYHKGQTFKFLGDDDVWVFVEGKLVVDLGGLHTARMGMVNMDDVTPALVEGNTYQLDIFHAERRSIDSGFHIETSICDRFNP